MLLVMLQRLSRSEVGTVVDQNADVRGEDVEVVVIVAGDGQVPHPAVMDGRRRAADYYRDLAIRRLEPLTIR